MLKEAKAFSSFSVNDTEKVKQFYRGVLGLNVTEDREMGEILTINTAENSHIIVYPKPNHTPATFTVLNFMVDNIEEAVRQLKAKGVSFESYDSEYLKTDEDNISRGEVGPYIAWFKDPAGNILSALQERH